MLLVQKELGEKKSFKSHLDFPTIIYELGHIVFKIIDKPAFGKEFVRFELFEYYNDNPVRRHKRQVPVSKGQSVGFDLSKDYYLQDDKKYALKTTIYIESNREIFDVVFIQL